MDREGTEAGIPRIDGDEQPQDKRAWVTPVVSESPVNELTASGFSGKGSDNQQYS